MKPELKRLHSPDVHDLRTYVPPDAKTFSVFVQAMIGPEGEDAEESFDFTVCSPEWIRRRTEDGPVIGAHHIIVARLYYDELTDTIREFCSRCEGDTWKDVAMQLAQLGHWEFAGYRE